MGADRLEIDRYDGLKAHRTGFDGLRSPSYMGMLRYLLIAVPLLFVGFAVFDWYAAAPPEGLAKATFVGRNSCAACHQEELELWTGSHHDRAMELATEETVLGDFNGETFDWYGEKTRYWRDGKKFMVTAEGPEGEPHDYEVKYTFGFTPLQQYMVEFPDGRVQVQRVSWNTEKQEWFYVTPPDVTAERIPAGDPLHWTGITQNWNSTCAECHSTNLKKNYDLAANAYHTTFSEIDVSCEECHGPASLHLQLASAKSLFWDRRHGYGLAKLKSVDSTPQIDTCAKCHARAQSKCMAIFGRGARFADHYDAGRCWMKASTTPMGNSLTRFITTARSCKARCTRRGCAARIATIRIR